MQMCLKGQLLRWEKGGFGFSGKMLVALAKVLDCRPGDLLNYDPDSPAYQASRLIEKMAAPKQELALRLIQTLDREKKPPE